MSFTPGGKPPRQDTTESIMMDLQRRVKALEENLLSNSWRNLSYQTGAGTGNWSDYGAAGLWSPAGYMIDATGFCHIRGLVKNGTAVSYPATNTLIAIGLPEPQEAVMGQGMFIDTLSHTGIARLDIYNTAVGGVGGAGKLLMAGTDYGYGPTVGNNGLYSWMALIFRPYRVA